MAPALPPIAPSRRALRALLRVRGLVPREGKALRVFLRVKKPAPSALARRARLSLVSPTHTPTAWPGFGATIFVRCSPIASMKRSGVWSMIGNVP